MIDISVLNKLNVSDASERLENLRSLVKDADFPAVIPEYINNHIHTTYSFSPYSPAAAVYAARAEGLSTAGIVDHDTIAGAREFIEAGKIAGIPTTVGMECRVRMTGTSLINRRTNNPDQVGVSYMTFQGVPHRNIEKLDSFFAPLREKRNERNRAMVSNINSVTADLGITLDFDDDVLPLSNAAHGGSVTERHLMLALSRKILKSGKSPEDFLSEAGIALCEGQRKKLAETGDPFYEYTLLGILKGSFVKRIFVPAADECPELHEVVSLADEVGAVLCYAYLGDVSESVTGDKAAQKFEDSYLEELFSELYDAGVRAVTYMPTRNTTAQLERVRALCDSYDMMQVSGEDINSPSQSFVIRAMENPMFSNLIDSTWRLIENENRP